MSRNFLLKTGAISEMLGMVPVSSKDFLDIQAIKLQSLDSIQRVCDMVRTHSQFTRQKSTYKTAQSFFLKKSQFGKMVEC